VAAVRPRPLVDRIAEPGADGVLDDVAAGGVQVALVLDRPRREAVCEEVPEAPVALVERLRVAALEPLNAPRELGLGAVQDDVVVRRHEAERVQRPAVSLGARPHVGQERAPVVVVPENRAAVHAATGDVEVAVRKRGSENARHASIQAALGPPQGACGRTGALSAHLAPSHPDVSRVRPWFSPAATRSCDSPSRSRTARTPRARAPARSRSGGTGTREP
jgi:hypothetical protein